MSEAARVFSPTEIGLALALAVGVEAVLVVLMMMATNQMKVEAQQELVTKPVPISVKPILDDAPLLKLGGKRVTAKLPDMWLKPKPVKRYEAKSAPSEAAKAKPEDIPTTPVATADAAAPPPDAEVGKEVDDEIEQLDAGPDVVLANTDEEGAADGVREGTETDPLKARAVSLYRAKIIGWFSARFRVPSGSIPCETLQGLRASVAAQVGGNRAVTGYSITGPSGNSAFDGRVRATMDAIVGQELPPPPPNYPDILESTVFPVFLGKGQKCE